MCYVHNPSPFSCSDVDWLYFVEDPSISPDEAAVLDILYPLWRQEWIEANFRKKLLSMVYWSMEDDIQIPTD